jgi:hypothetical protein
MVFEVEGEKVATCGRSFEVTFLLVVMASSQFLPGMIITRRVTEGRMREHVASDITPSLAYASGCD